VTASCDPCTVEIGKAATVTANAQDPDGDAITYKWSAASGSLSNATARQTPWIAPNTPGAVNFTVTVSDGRGGTASATTTINVTAPVKREITFDDVHFDFDRSLLRPDALRVLDEVVKEMQTNSSLRLQIEGHTCNIGTAEYNLALGERRAHSVRDYLISRGIAADRLSTVAYGDERPKHDNTAEDTRRLNRRAALTVRLQ
jgi:outer membrane protein OmpA-like peptidoglycan-associated protein